MIWTLWVNNFTTFVVLIINPNKIWSDNGETHQLNTLYLKKKNLLKASKKKIAYIKIAILTGLKDVKEVKSRIHLDAFLYKLKRPSFPKI